MVTRSAIVQRGSWGKGVVGGEGWWYGGVSWQTGSSTCREGELDKPDWQLLIPAGLRLES